MGFMTKMDNQEDELISLMLQGYNQTNLQDMGLSSQEDISTRIGIIVDNSPDKHNIYNAINFDPVQTKFLQKMVSKNIIEKRIRTIKQDYFKTVSYLSFFTDFIIDNNDILDEMTKRTSQLERIDPFLDPNLELCIRCCSLNYMADYKPIARNDRRKNNYRSNNPEIIIEYSNLRKINPIHQATGNVILQQLNNEEIKQRLKKVSKPNDLSSMLFIDANLDLYKDQVKDSYYKRAENQILKLVDSKQYLKAAHVSMEKVAKNLSKNPISHYMNSMQPTTY